MRGAGSNGRLYRDLSIYKSRWKVELFFKWIKQHLRIKAFYRISKNDVKSQIWIAISVYVLGGNRSEAPSYPDVSLQLLQALSLTLFDKTPILLAFEDIYSE